ncbi:phosphotransferase family protein [Actinoplanes derwentensis]|uniref:Predicted kinase, aminoglycoside phosphotransferase (APT) family n=1 Tax=Actinoplanes derwentensis TaxID=113562 RepID=A0A1H1TG48_9ACTN|nr:aminoglycoside phosphotransferase family protein [Actinoplanes derwentensis]GID89501.1 aminoglycoside phosphotransferase [Actinoplanes derwentensis]SDS58509.1 Predicted kinase, aminoglycoside phosphotransferase (APT) family [Actinoplanes derwentensis]
MESITKNRQSLQTLRAMVARAYGPDQVPGPSDQDWVTELGHGWFNVAYLIRLRDGRRVVLKIAPPAHVEVMTYERGAMDTELAALELVRRHTDVPVPAVDHADDSRELCDAAYFFMPYIDADNLAVIKPDLPKADLDAYSEAVGRANRQINTIRGTAFGPLSGPGDPSWRACFTRMIDAVLSDGERRKVDLGYDYALIRALVDRHADCLDEVTEPRFVEWDLWDGNVMVRDGAIAGIVDHERAFYGDPLIEVGFTPVDLPAFGDATAFIRGYGHPDASHEFTPGGRSRRKLYTLYLVLIMVIETVYRAHTDTGSYDWARARLQEVMALFDTAEAGGPPCPSQPIAGSAQGVAVHPDGVTGGL